MSCFAWDGLSWDKQTLVNTEAGTGRGNAYTVFCVFSISNFCRNERIAYSDSAGSITSQNYTAHF